MAKHCKIKCEKKKEYQKVKDVLNIRAIEHYQEKEGKPIHLCGFEKKKDIEKILNQYGLTKFKIKTVEPDLKEIDEEYEY